MTADTLFLVISAIALVLLLASLGFHGQRRTQERPRELTHAASSSRGESEEDRPTHSGHHGCC